MLLLAGSVASMAVGSVRPGTTVDLGGPAPPRAMAAGPNGVKAAEDNPPFRISPNGQYVVQRSASGLFSRRLPDGPWTQLAPPSSCWDGSEKWLITDDSQTVLFFCLGATMAPKDLWAVPVAGPASAAVLLSAAPDDPLGVNDFFSAISGSRVCYTMTGSSAERNDLYSVPVAGPAAEGVVINGVLDEFGSASGPFPLQSIPRVVFGLWSLPPRSGEIWLTDLAAANAIPIGISAPSHPFGGSYEVSPDEQHVIWNAGGAVFSAPIADPPGAAIPLSPDLPAGRNADFRRSALTAPVWCIARIRSILRGTTCSASRSAVPPRPP